MAILDSSLATKGIDFSARLSILRRHFYSFSRHLTIRKCVNFVHTEINRILHNEKINSFPYILKIEPSNICNLHCAYCYDNRRKPNMGEREYGRMQVEQFTTLIDEIGKYLFKINLYGFGEPWLFPETFQMIRYATDNNIGVAVSSNMNSKKENLHSQILDSGLEVLIVSIHGASQKTYSHFMKGGDLDVALTNIKHVVEERNARKSSIPFIDWQFCVTGFNQHEIPFARKIATDIGIDQVRFIRPFFPEDAPEEWFSSMFPRRTVRYDDGPANCSWPYRSAYINWDGGVLPCCREFRPLINDFGNVFRDSFSLIWNNKRYLASRRLLAGRSGTSEETICDQCPIILKRKKEQ